jgi:prefoldin subunit 5
LTDPSNVLVDVGTGYYVSKVHFPSILTDLESSYLLSQELKSAKTSYNAKSLSLKNTIQDELSPAIEKKAELRDIVIRTLTEKVRESQRAAANQKK